MYASTFSLPSHPWLPHFFFFTSTFNQSGNGVGLGVNVGGDNNNVNANVGIATKRDNLSDSPFLDDSQDIPASLVLEYQVNESNTTLNVNNQFHSTDDDGKQTDDVFESFYQDINDSGQGNDVNVVFLENEADF